MGDAPVAEVVCCRPAQVHPGDLGPVALFDAGELVAYRLCSRRKRRFYVFRTLVVADRLAPMLPGVHPGVALLLGLRTLGRERLTVRLFDAIRGEGLEPGSLSDTFYVRVGGVLAGRVPPLRVLLTLLQRERALVRFTRGATT